MAILFLAEAISGDPPEPEVYGISSNDVLVGDTTVDGLRLHAFVARTLDTVTKVSVPNASSTSLKAVNDAGVAVGTWRDQQNNAHAFIYDAGNHFVDLASLIGPQQSWAKDINSQGVVVGNVQTSGSVESPNYSSFVYDPAASPAVQILRAWRGYASSMASAINDHGQVVGTCYKSDWIDYRPYRYDIDSGDMEDFSGVNANGIDINEQGHILCVHQDAIYTGGNSGPFIWSNGNIVQIPVNGIPYAMNDSDMVVGYAGFGTTPYGFLYAGGVVWDLNTLLLPNVIVTSPALLRVTGAFDINNEGRIAAAGWDTSDVFQGYGLLLVPEFAFNPVQVIDYVVHILFGVLQDGGGQGYLGRRPVPVDPWGWLTNTQIGIVFARAKSIVEEQYRSDLRARREAITSLERLQLDIENERGM